ncbi:MAG: immunoglobulin domain-containing protein [Verrucomicrobia bacterium]|nr:immunoglobulin domain-containing protein [Verrucomicrobiota bacterium]
MPDPLRFFDFEAGTVWGEMVTDRLDWRERRRPEIMDMMRHYMYGAEPGAPVNMQFTVESVDPNFMEGLATKKVIRGVYGPPGTAPMILAVYVPNHAEGPVPVLVGLNRNGHEAIEPGGSRADRWDLEGTLQAGIALATAAHGDFASDGSGFRNSLITPYAESGFHGDWRTIAAWAWGMSRMVDYLETDPDIDPHRIAGTGYSRRGKTALWAAALDERFALVAPHQTGTGGSHPTRSTWGWSPTFRHQFPHWFLVSYNQVDIEVSPNDYYRQPFDQHFAVALVAPRRVLMSENNSFGAGQTGLRAIKRAAQPVWNLFGLDPEEHVVLEWNGTSGHSFIPEHWAVIHDAVHDLPLGGMAGFRIWAEAAGLVEPGASEEYVREAAAQRAIPFGAAALETYLFGGEPDDLASFRVGLVREADGAVRIRIPHRRDAVGWPGRGSHWRGIRQWVEHAEHPDGPWTPFGVDELLPVAVEPGPTPESDTLHLEVQTLEGSDLRFFRVRYSVVGETHPPLVLRHPSDQTVVEGDPAYFSAVLTGRPLTFSQWQKNGEDIPGATGVDFSIESTSLNDTGYYRIRTGNADEEVFSREAMLQVIPDTTAPTVVEAEILSDTLTRITFSDPVEEGAGPYGAENPANYSFAPHATVHLAALQDDLQTVLIQTDALTLGESYILTVHPVNSRTATPIPGPEQQLLLRHLWVARINFQPASVEAPPGWRVDSGNLFGPRGDGLDYGWTSEPGTARQRNQSVSPDVMHDTLIHCGEAGAETDPDWEIALPNGSYDLRVVMGDAQYTSNSFSLAVQGSSFLSGSTSNATRWIENRQEVEVQNGRLTLSRAPGAVRNKLNFIEIRVME